MFWLLLVVKFKKNKVFFVHSKFSTLKKSTLFLDSHIFNGFVPSQKHCARVCVRVHEGCTSVWISFQRGVMHLNLIKNEVPEYRWRIMSFKLGEGELRLIKSSCPATKTIYFRQKKEWRRSPLSFYNRVVCIKMQRTLADCTWRMAKISQGKFSTYRWIADLLQ